MLVYPTSTILLDSRLSVLISLQLRFLFCLRNHLFSVFPDHFSSLGANGLWLCARDRTHPVSAPLCRCSDCHNSVSTVHIWMSVPMFLMHCESFLMPQELFDEEKKNCSLFSALLACLIQPVRIMLQFNLLIIA